MTIILACIAAFLAGFVDSIAGGGGLIQVPAMLFLFPQFPIVTLLGTNKLAASAGTVISSFHYLRALKIDVKKFLLLFLAAFIFSILGAKALTLIHNDILRPIIFILLIVMAIYTFVKKDFGLISNHKIHGMQLQLLLLVIGATLGFYDGFFGPGMGSLLMFCLVSLIGFSFLEGSALAKLTNLTSNVAALLFFIVHHKVIYKVGVPMAVFNILGNSVGSRLAIRKGSSFVRWIFLGVIGGLLIQMLPRLLALH